MMTITSMITYGFQEKADPQLEQEDPRISESQATDLISLWVKQDLHPAKNLKNPLSSSLENLTETNSIKRWNQTNIQILQNSF